MPKRIIAILMITGVVLAAPAFGAKAKLRYIKVEPNFIETLAEAHGAADILRRWNREHIDYYGSAVHRARAEGEKGRSALIGKYEARNAAPSADDLLQDERPVLEYLVVRRNIIAENEPSLMQAINDRKAVRSVTAAIAKAYQQARAGRMTAADRQVAEWAIEEHCELTARNRGYSMAMDTFRADRDEVKSLAAEIAALIAARQTAMKENRRNALLSVGDGLSLKQMIDQEEPVMLSRPLVPVRQKAVAKPMSVADEPSPSARPDRTAQAAKKLSRGSFTEADFNVFALPATEGRPKSDAPSGRVWMVARVGRYTVLELDLTVNWQCLVGRFCLVGPDEAAVPPELAFDRDWKRIDHKSAIRAPGLYYLVYDATLVAGRLDYRLEADGDRFRTIAVFAVEE